MRKYQFVTGIHGDEKLPIIALAGIGETQFVANLLALAKNKRFIERDMNASFGTGGSTYEEKEAGKFVSNLDKKKFVVDFHTNQSMEEPFVIIVDKKMIPFASTLGIDKVIYMKFNVKKGHSLIDLIDGVSVEVGNHNSINSIRNTIKVTEKLKEGRKRKITLYEVFGIIRKPGKYVNFQKCTQGFVPIFAGKNTYNCYGLKARILKIT